MHVPGDDYGGLLVSEVADLGKRIGVLGDVYVGVVNLALIEVACDRFAGLAARLGQYGDAQFVPKSDVNGLKGGCEGGETCAGNFQFGEVDRSAEECSDSYRHANFGVPHLVTYGGLVLDLIHAARFSYVVVDARNPHH